MSLAMVLANQYGIVMSADKRMTLAPKPLMAKHFFIRP